MFTHVSRCTDFLWRSGRCFHSCAMIHSCSSEIWEMFTNVSFRACVMMHLLSFEILDMFTVMLRDTGLLLRPQENSKGKRHDADPGADNEDAAKVEYDSDDANDRDDHDDEDESIMGYG